MTSLQLIPVVLVMHVCLQGAKLKNKKVVFHNDSQALILNRQTSKSQRVMLLLRPFIINCMLNSICFSAVHIPTPTNHDAIADSIFRKQWQLFRQTEPQHRPNHCRSPDPSSILYAIRIKISLAHPQSVQFTIQLNAFLMQQNNLTYQSNHILQNFKVSKTQQTNFLYLSCCKV